MNDQIMKVLISFGTVGIMAGLVWLNNNRRIKRVKQFPFLFFTPLLMTAEVVLLTLYRIDITQFLASVSWLEPIYTFIYQATGIVIDAEILFLNLLLIVPYFVLKLILRPIFSLFMNLGNGKIISRWYEPAPKKGAYLLKNSAINLRSLWRTVALTMALCASLICAITWVFGSQSPLWVYVYPTAAWVVIAEVCWFLSGLTREEYENRFGGEGTAVSRLSNYGKLKKILESIFPEALLTAHTGREYNDRIGSSDLLHQLQVSDDKIDRQLARYFLHLPGKKEGSFDVDLIKACSNLLHGHSTIISNPFYHDLDDYLTLPLINMLLTGRKILVVCGRQSMTGDVAGWLGDLLGDYCRTDKLWKIGMLDEEANKDVGILSFSNLYDPKIIFNNSEFLGEVGFVLLIEPSCMLTTAQAGLSIVVGKMNQIDKPVFCAVDREVDGLVDLLSHLFLQNVTNVVAAPPIRPLFTAMSWDADSDYHRQNLFQQETHYLGNGVELAATALKYQVPEVSWYSEDKAPVNDLRWIAQQYYRQICQYAGIPCRQTALDNTIHFISNPLDSAQQERAFIIAEDEYCNIFAMMRAYLTRATKDLFVNIISENYLMRDYMRYNWRLFMNDAKAIPTIMPHYAKTERNSVIRLVIMMAGEPVPEEYIRHELQMLGYKDGHTYDQLSGLITKYLDIRQTIITVTTRRENSLEGIQIPTMYYEIPRKKFDKAFNRTLRNAFFVVEDEKLETELIDARMFQHITQLVMPGQQIVHGGKAYRVHRVSLEIGCILHRSADLYSSRLYYRQIRTYMLNDLQDESSQQASGIISRRVIGDIEIIFQSMDFTVKSDGYLEMKDQHDLTTAKRVDMSGDPAVVQGIYERKYSNKTVIKLKLSRTDRDVRYTLSLLLSELFKTIFPYSWQFIAVLTEKPTDPAGMLHLMTYDLAGKYDADAIYIVEDSTMDLGILEAIDQNMFRLFEILADYLNWHAEKISEPPLRDPGAQRHEEPKVSTSKGNIFQRMWQGITSIFRRKEKGKEPAEEKKPETEEKPAEESENPGFVGMQDDGKDNIQTLPTTFQEKEKDGTDKSNEPSDKNDRRRTKRNDKDELPPVLGDGDFIGIDVIDDDLDLRMPVPRSKYDDSCFLKFGFDEIEPTIALEELQTYLNSHGFGKNSLYEARKPKISVEPVVEGSERCDFCGCYLTGVQYERLEDGRIRCGRCSASAVTDINVFRELFSDTMTLISENFNMLLESGIQIMTVDAKTLGKLSKVLFRPTPDYDGRVIGLARQTGHGYELYIENGSPRLSTIATMAHEATHIWQYQNWKKKQIRAEYGRKNELAVYEGMAVWVEIQVLYILGEFTYAAEQEHLSTSRTDEYGKGFRWYLKQYGMSRNGTEIRKNPFNQKLPLDRAIVMEEESE